MKKLLLLIGVVTVSTLSFGQSIVGTPHDFGAASFNGSSWTNDRCYVCHQSHGNVSGPDTLLWNQTISTETFTMYSNPSGTLTGTIDASPSGTSLMCLSCHDDATSMGTGGTISTEYGGTTANVGTDLSNDHPIGITYDEVSAGHGLNASGGLSFAVLYSNKVECASCHNAHDNSNTYFLRTSNNASALCLDCHDK